MNRFASNFLEEASPRTASLPQISFQESENRRKSNYSNSIFFHRNFLYKLLFKITSEIIICPNNSLSAQNWMNNSASVFSLENIFPLYPSCVFRNFSNSSHNCSSNEILQNFEISEKQQKAKNEWMLQVFDSRYVLQLERIMVKCSLWSKTQIC